MRAETSPTTGADVPTKQPTGVTGERKQQHAHDHQQVAYHRCDTLAKPVKQPTKHQTCARVSERTRIENGIELYRSFVTICNGLIWAEMAVNTFVLEHGQHGRPTKHDSRWFPG